jgi:hypothetical protein
MQVPCCDLVYHASCGVQKLGDSIHLDHRVNCQCGALLFQCNSCFSETVPETETTIEMVMAKPGVPAQVKAIKAKFTAEGKARAAYKKYLAEKYAEFAEQMSVHKTAIEEMKESMMATIKESEEFKKFRRLKGVSSLAKNKFGTEHSLRGRILRRLFEGRDWMRWYDTPVNMLNRRFRIRL